jgi:hypothetical protein
MQFCEELNWAAQKLHVMPVQPPEHLQVQLVLAVMMPVAESAWLLQSSRGLHARAQLGGTPPKPVTQEAQSSDVLPYAGHVWHFAPVHPLRHVHVQPCFHVPLTAVAW